MTLSLGHHAARTLDASMALTPSTTHGGHPASRGAPVGSPGCLLSLPGTADLGDASPAPPPLVGA
jgi:hypothetical protein